MNSTFYHFNRTEVCHIEIVFTVLRLVKQFSNLWCDDDDYDSLLESKFDVENRIVMTRTSVIDIRWQTLWGGPRMSVHNFRVEKGVFSRMSIFYLVTECLTLTATVITQQEELQSAERVLVISPWRKHQPRLTFPHFVTTLWPKARPLDRRWLVFFIWDYHQLDTDE